jgi:hypothetical protein
VLILTTMMTPDHWVGGWCGQMSTENAVSAAVVDAERVSGTTTPDAPRKAKKAAEKQPTQHTRS